LSLGYITISFKTHKTAPINLECTINALININRLIDAYSADKPGPAYVKFDHVLGHGLIDVQINRAIIVPALKAQREELVKYLATLGIDASDFV
jgi:hypothetical protein